MYPYTIKRIVAALLAAGAGSQSVHMLYNPEQNLPKLIEEEKERLRKRIAKKKMENPHHNEIPINKIE